MSAIAMLEELAEHGPEQWEAAFVQMPRLLSAGLHQALEVELAAAPPDRAEKARPVLDYLVERRTYFEANPTQYPFGDGPIERLFGRVRSGQTTLETACELARAPEVSGVVGLLYLRVLDLLVKVRADAGHVDAAFLQALALAATEALPDLPEARALRELVVLRGCETAQRALIEAPEPFLFTQARDAALALLAMPGIRDELAGDLHHQLGVLHLDPYTAGKPTVAYATAIDVWSRRYLPGRERTEMIPGIRARGMPEPAEALRVASEHLAQAAELRRGHLRGLTEKALLSALVFRRLALGEEVPTDEICGLAARALADLPDQPPFQRARLAVEGMREAVGCTGDVELGDVASLEQELADLPPAQGFQLAITLSRDARRPVAERLRMVEEVAARSTELPDLARSHLAARELSLLFEATPAIGVAPADAEALRSALDAWQAGIADAEPEVAALRAYQLAIACNRLGAEGPIARLVDLAERLAPALIASRPAFLVMRGQLFSDTAAAAFNGGAHDVAAELNLRAAMCFVAVSMPGLAVTALERAADAIEGGTLLTGMRALGGIARHAPGLETRLGPPATVAVQRILTCTLDHLAREASSSSTVPCFHALKGARLAVALDRSSIPLVDAPELAEIDELERSLPDDVIREIYPADGGVDEESLLASPLDLAIRRDGASDAARVVNLQARFDRDLAERMLGSDDDVRPSHLRDDASRRAALDERTVLVDLYWDVARRAMYTVLSSRERTVAGRADTQKAPFARIQTDGDVDLTPVGMQVLGIRRRVVLDVELRDVDAVAAGSLADQHAWLFGAVLEDLAAFRAEGKDHLCIVPHGALHYAPLHLAGPAGHPLASDWIVTYLPNLALLGRPRRSGDRRAREMAAYGVTFAGTTHALPQAASEVRAIAGVFGAQPMLDADAHREAVLDGLATARYVHLCTHGRHNVAAPWFQTMFCGGGTLLRAHDLVGRDLGGLEVVTLAACETGLGRFDGGDNLTGLPAAIFLGGAETLVGTLWNVDSSTAEVFFTSFYDHLRRGASRLDAFATAQRDTREWSPRYRHWGAFFLSGAWT